MTIDLKLPTGWQMCTTEQLETVAAEIIRGNLTATRFHPFDWTEVKTRLFFALTGVKVIEPPLCRLGKTEFQLETWQIHSFIEQHLGWIDATDKKGKPLPMPKMRFPYPQRIRRWSWRLWQKDYYTPGGELLDGMTWQTYRWINDWLEVYTMKANELIERRDDALACEVKGLQKKIAALIFGCPEWRARRITDVEWQVLMFWWQSMMQYLKEQYPKCFHEPSKRKGRKSGQQPLAIELYTRSMATLQKYLGGLTEEQINRQSAHNILRHLNDMAVEAEEMEKLRRKK